MGIPLMHVKFRRAVFSKARYSRVAVEAPTWSRTRPNGPSRPVKSGGDVGYNCRRTGEFSLVSLIVSWHCWTTEVTCVKGIPICTQTCTVSPKRRTHPCCPLECGLNRPLGPDRYPRHICPAGHLHPHPHLPLSLLRLRRPVRLPLRKGVRPFPPSPHLPGRRTVPPLRRLLPGVCCHRLSISARIPRHIYE